MGGRSAPAYIRILNKASPLPVARQYAPLIETNWQAAPVDLIGRREYVNGVADVCHDRDAACAVAREIEVAMVGVKPSAGLDVSSFVSRTRRASSGATERATVRRFTKENWIVIATPGLAGTIAGFATLDRVGF